MSAAEAAEVVTAEISEPLTWAEICARYPDEWVCIVEIDHIHPNGLEFRTARVSRIGGGREPRAAASTRKHPRSRSPFSGRRSPFSGRRRILVEKIGR